MSNNIIYLTCVVTLFCCVISLSIKVRELKSKSPIHDTVYVIVHEPNTAKVKCISGDNTVDVDTFVLCMPYKNIIKKP